MRSNAMRSYLFPAFKRVRKPTDADVACQQKVLLSFSNGKEAAFENFTKLFEVSKHVVETCEPLDEENKKIRVSLSFFPTSKKRTIEFENLNSAIDWILGRCILQTSALYPVPELSERVNGSK